MLQKQIHLCNREHFHSTTKSDQFCLLLLYTLISLATFVQFRMFVQHTSLISTIGQFNFTRYTRAPNSLISKPCTTSFQEGIHLSTKCLIPYHVKRFCVFDFSNVLHCTGSTYYHWYCVLFQPCILYKHLIYCLKDMRDMYHLMRNVTHLNPTCH